MELAASCEPAERAVLPCATVCLGKLRFRARALPFTDCSSLTHRDHPADEVYVTGTFDNWSKSVKLEKDGSSFSKTVDIPASTTNAKIHYKVRTEPLPCPDRASHPAHSTTSSC